MLTQHLYGTYKHGMQKHGTLMRILTGYVRYTFKRNISFAHANAQTAQCTSSSLCTGK